ncbi:hypothetical protein [Capnocytophaga leadbetteri]|uniref:hypothetical protein n=1 Tax=Capnocytophaga leadbetteri TaxID=327575 RepID=UPI0026E93660|nr:hypothetical protein [Capnocytophaga leadbetteri]
MTLAYFSEKHKIAFADAFEAMTCNIPSSIDYKEPALEEKDFDENGRLLERRFVHYGRPRLVERYDYNKGIVHKSFYEFGREILEFSLPLYSEQELRAKHIPIKERVQNLGFAPKQVTEISLKIKSTDKIGGMQQKTWHGCEGYFEKAHRTSIDNITCDERDNICAIEEYVSSWGEQRIEYRAFDAQNNQIFQAHSWEEDTLSSIEVSLYDKQNQVIQRIDTNRYGGFRGIKHYTYKGDEVIRTKIYLNNPKEIAEESSKLIEKKGDKTVETICTEDDHRGKEEVTTIDLTGKIIKKTETNYLVKYKNWIGEKKVRSDEITNKTVQEYTYNEAGVLVKEVSRYVDKDNEDVSWSDGYYSTEIILYNEQGQKVECNEKREYKNSLKIIGKRPNLEFQTKDEIFLERTLYYYDSEGNLTREELKKWRADEGIETDVELLTTHHFYFKEDECEEHLKVIVKENI